MAKTLDVQAMPEVHRVVTVSRWALVAAQVRDFLADEKLRTAKILAFDASDLPDGLTWDEKSSASLMQAVRNSAKAEGVKVLLRNVDGIVYVKEDGPFISRGPHAKDGNGSGASTTSAANRSTTNKAGSGARK